jgi:hypothetical protein
MHTKKPFEKDTPHHLSRDRKEKCNTNGSANFFFGCTASGGPWPPVQFFAIHPYPVPLSSNFGTQAFLHLPPLHLSISALDGPFLFALPDY